MLFYIFYRFSVTHFMYMFAHKKKLTTFIANCIEMGKFEANCTIAKIHTHAHVHISRISYVELNCDKVHHLANSLFFFCSLLLRIDPFNWLRTIRKPVETKKIDSK